MEIIYKQIEDLVPYENNPRNNENSILEVMESIKEYGFRVPILIDKNNVIVAGHTRYEASKLLKLKELPCILIDNLNEEQIRAFRIADNKVSEFSRWDYEKLKKELSEIELHGFDFENYYKLDVKDSDFINEEKLEKEKKEKFYICPNCMEKFK